MYSSSQISGSVETDAANTQTTSDNSNDETNFLVFEPDIIKGRTGERLWHVQATRECVTLCKSQLKVY